jgi:hypothetical protein
VGSSQDKDATPGPRKSGVPNCWLSGRPLLKKCEKWRTLSYFLSTLKDTRVIVPR